MTCREIVVALPGDTDDLYRRHQQVWEVMKTHATSGVDFLYRMMSPRMARIRSETLSRGEDVSLCPGPWMIDVVAMRVVNRNEAIPVPIDEITGWTRIQFDKHGFTCREVTVAHHWVATGMKPPRRGQPGHVISYAAARVRVVGDVSNGALAQKAWRLGIGRGRRFGFGMLSRDDTKPG